MLSPRNITQTLLDALGDTPIVLLHGARQSGKSTLARLLAEDGLHPATYYTLDDLAVLSAATGDPAGFLAGLSGPVILDEIQRAPELLLPMKATVDRDRRPGRFLLTGSAHVLALPQISEAFTGRMEVLTLWPFSQGELEGHQETFLDRSFSDTAFSKPKRPFSGDDLLERIVRGGYPEAVARARSERRRAWFDSYINTLLQRDVRDLSEISGLAELPRLLAALAARAGGLVNYADLARDAGMNQMTLKRYFTLLQAVFLVLTVQPWFSNRTKRLVKSEKLYFVDTGILAHLLNVSHDDLARDTRAKGALLENFVATELLKQRCWSQVRTQLYHFRQYTGEEVDFVLEAPGAHKLVGIEVKAAASVQSSDFKGLRAFAEATGKSFHRGILLYTGQEIVPFGKNLHAVPVRSLWTW